MRLLFIRHASAVPSGTPGIADEDRPLTPEGEARFRKAAVGLACLASRPDLILTSPLPRARRTAEIAAEAWGDVPVVPTDELATGRFDGIAQLLGQHPAEAKLVLVGHEPTISALLARLVGSSREEAFAFRKGAAALVELDGAFSDGGRLLWFLSPKALRAIADS
ncbi:MAG: histidine phosphatase family protein [Vicinamibacteria bacterium]|nr:histidine phosphatase family protein [Vicinamibacteria bacterium]